MRIIAKAKPIRIRIKSGGEEHSSLRLFASESLCARLVAIGKRQAVVKMVDAVG